jgi:hypothetical protein
MIAIFYLWMSSHEHTRYIGTDMSSVSLISTYSLGCNRFVKSLSNDVDTHSNARHHQNHYLNGPYNLVICDFL